MAADIARLIKEDPTEARRLVEVSFLECGSAMAAAARYGVHKATFGRWMHALGLGALIEGQRGKRGPDKRRRKKGSGRSREKRS